MKNVLIKSPFLESSETLQCIKENTIIKSPSVKSGFNFFRFFIYSRMNNKLGNNVHQSEKACESKSNISKNF